VPRVGNERHLEQGFLPRHDAHRDIHRVEARAARRGSVRSPAVALNEPEACAPQDAHLSVSVASAGSMSR
jgi:hypothetical protein